MPFSDEIYKGYFSMPSKDTNIKKIEILKKDIKKLSYEESIVKLENILINLQDEIKRIDEEERISILVLGVSTGSSGPGPLVTHITSRGSSGFLERGRIACLGFMGLTSSISSG